MQPPAPRTPLAPTAPAGGAVPARAADSPGRRWLERAARGVLLLLACYHVLTGVIAMAFPDLSLPFYEGLYEFDPDFTVQYQLILKPWGAYAVFTGLVLFPAFLDPRRYRGLVVALCLLLLLRCGYRTLYAAEAAAVFGISPGRNALNVGLMVGYLAALVPWTVATWREPGRA